MNTKCCFLIMLHILFLSARGQTDYSANGNGGFGGAIGQSSLRISATGSQINFTLTKGAGRSLDRIMVMYIDARPGGFTSTSGFADNADVLRSAISAFDGSNRCTISFPAGFEADFAVAIDPGNTQNSGALFELVNGSSNALIQRTSVNLSPANTENSSTYDFTIGKSQIDVQGGITFKFIITYIGNNAFLSDEGYGGGLVNGNPGRSNAVFTTFQTFPLTVLPVNFVRFEIKTLSSVVQLQWQIEQTGDLRKMIVERSRTGVSYSPIGEIDAAAGVNVYSFTDLDPVEGNNFYRIRAVDNQDFSKHSDVRQSIFKRIDNSIFIYNNPVKDQVRFSTANLRRGKWDVLITSITGQKITSSSVDKGDQVTLVSIALPSILQRGVYYLVISNRYEFYKQSFVVY